MKKVENAVSQKVEKVNKQETSKKEILIYCGPTIKGIVRQNDHFINGIPNKLKEYSNQHKSVERLIVPLKDIIDVKKNLTIPGTVENISYLSIQKGE